MNFVIYIISAVVAFLLFWPTTDVKEIRNLPLLIVLLALIAAFLLWQLIRRILFVQKIKKTLKNNGCEIIKTYFNPFSACFHGRYSVFFKRNGKAVSARLLMGKRKYQHYHFESLTNLEFYRTTRTALKSGAGRAVMSNQVDTKLVGKQPLIWDEADLRIVVFDTLPDHITDSKQKNPLSKGDKICATETYIADLESFSGILTEIL